MPSLCFKGILARPHPLGCSCARLVNQSKAQRKKDGKLEFCFGDPSIGLHGMSLLTAPICTPRNGSTSVVAFARSRSTLKHVLQLSIFVRCTSRENDDFANSDRPAVSDRTLRVTIVFRLKFSREVL